MWKQVAVVLLLGYYGPRVFRALRPILIERTVYNHRPGPCQYVKGIEEGSEDMQVLSSGIALISTGIRSKTHPPFDTRKGFIKMFDFNKPEKGAEVVKVEGDHFDLETLNPHGISIWESPETRRVLVFVINHGEFHLGKAVETVEKFEFVVKTKVLRHLESITNNDTMHFMNDLVATGENSFYFTNSAYSRRPAFMTVEILFKLAWGSVGYYDGKTSKLVVTGLDVPNGINISPDKRFVYVAVGGIQSLLIYQREANDELTLYQVVETDSLIDNIDVQNDYVWLGCHCSLLKVAAYMDNPGEDESPSQILRLKVMDGKVTEMVEVFSDDGAFFSGSSVAVPYKDKILIGTVVSKALLCENKYIG